MTDLQGGGQLGLLLVLWLGVMALIVVVRYRRGSEGAGLVPAYLVSLSLIHWFPAAVNRSELLRGPNLELVETGFRQSVLAILGFAIATTMTSLLVRPAATADEGTDAQSDQRRFAVVYLLVGVFAYIALFSPVGLLPTVTAITAVGQQLFVVGACLLCWHGWNRQRAGQLVLGILFAALLPLFTVLDQGFLSFGAAAATVVIAFISSFLPRGRVIAISAIIGYLGLSLFVSYFRDREEIREVVWGGASLGARAQVLEASLRDFEFFSLSDPDHLSYVNQRLNQNILVGQAVRRLSVTHDFAQGSTLSESVLALVPRAVWPDKPIRAGSPEIATRYTGIRYAEGTSVGVGHVLEFYINFGTAGVFLGFITIGVILTLIDVRARRSLNASNERAFALWFLVGISFIHVGGSLVELSSSAGASLILAIVLNNVVLGRARELRSRPTEPVAT